MRRIFLFKILWDFSGIFVLFFVGFLHGIFYHRRATKRPGGASKLCKCFAAWIVVFSGGEGRFLRNFCMIFFNDRRMTRQEAR